MRKIFTLTLLSMLLLFGAAACSVLQAPEEASAPIEAVPLEVDQTQGDAGADAPAGGLTVYEIVPTESQVRFELDEDLRGSRITVVGTTDQVAGELALNLSDLAQTEVGIIRINARTLETDNSFRNRAIQNEILETGAYEFITFTPTAVNGLPTSAAAGDTLTFTIDGDLTVRDVTNPVTFEVEATAVSESQVVGTATTVIDREAFGLAIPSVPNVANVEEQVELYIDFTANAS